jgi:hypothetical protein
MAVVTVTSNNKVEIEIRSCSELDLDKLGPMLRVLTYVAF